MFGKGVYFADMVSKSANYCHTSQSDPVGLLLLAEVALGNMYAKAVFVSYFLSLYRKILLFFLYKAVCDFVFNFCHFNAGMN